MPHDVFLSSLCTSVFFFFFHFFFFNDTATTEIYTLSLHDALPIYKIDPDLIGKSLEYYYQVPFLAFEKDRELPMELLEIGRAHV